MIEILLIIYPIKDKIAIFFNFYTHFLLIWDTSRFCRESHTNPLNLTLAPPPLGTGLSHVKICMANPGVPGYRIYGNHPTLCLQQLQHQQKMIEITLQRWHQEFSYKNYEIITELFFEAF